MPIIPENNVRFTDLSNGTVKAGSVFATSEPDSSTPPSYDSTKVTAQAVGNFVATSQTYSGLQTTAKTLVGAINEATQGGGGSSTFSGLSDVQFNNLRDGQIPVYSTVTQKWYNAYLDAAVCLYPIDESGDEIVPDFLPTDLIDGMDNSPVFYCLCREIDGDSVYYTFLGADVGQATFARVVKENGRNYIEYVILTPWVSDPTASLVTIDKVPVGNIEVSGTLTAGATSITLSDAAITSSSTLQFFTDIFGVAPTAATVSTGSVTLTFEAQASNMTVKVRVS